MATSNQTITRLRRGAIPALVLAGFQAAAFPSSVPAQAGTPENVLTYLEPYASHEMSPAESGLIRDILVKEGEHVIKNQPLLKLDAETIEARLAVAMAQADNMGSIMAAESQFEVAKERYERLKEAGDQVTPYELKTQEGEMKAAEGRLTEALEQKRVFQLQAEQARAELGRRILKSPIDGQVTEITKDLAEPVSPIENDRDEYLIRVVRIDQLKAEAFLPGEWANRISKGDELELLLGDGQGEAPPKVTMGTVEFISPVNDSASNTVRLKLVVDNQNGFIRAGTAARIVLPDTRKTPGVPGP